MGTNDLISRNTACSLQTVVAPEYHRDLVGLLQGDVVPAHVRFLLHLILIKSINKLAGSAAK